MNDLIKQAMECAGMPLIVKREHVAAALLSYVRDCDDAVDDYSDEVYEGVEAALVDTDVVTVHKVSDVVRKVANDLIAAEAKRIALELIRDLAADNKKEDYVPF